MMRRRTDRPATERPPAVGVWIVQALILVVAGVVLAVAFAAGSARGGTITLHAIKHDPLNGTVTYEQALARIQYAGASPYVLTLNGIDGSITQGVLAQSADRLHYYCQAPKQCRLDATFTVWVAGRIFAAGFEP